MQGTVQVDTQPLLIIPAESRQLLAAAQDFLGIGQASLFSFQPRQFAGLQTELLEFFDLIAQELETGIDLGGVIAQMDEVFQPALPFAPGQAHLFGKVSLAREFIHQASVGILDQEGLVLVLAVDIYQHFAQRSKLLQGCGLAIDIGLGFTIAGNDPAQQALMGVICLL